MCVTGSTLLLTDRGYFPIEQLEDTEVSVWNGHAYIKRTVRYNGVDTVHRVTLDNSLTLDCTAGHLSQPLPTTIPSYTIPVRHRHVMNMNDTTDDDTIKFPYIQGYCANTTFQRDIVKVNDQARQHFLDAGVPVSTFDKTNFIVTNFVTSSIHFVPLNQKLSDQLQWLDGYLDAKPDLRGKSIWDRSLQLPTSVKVLLLSLGMTTIGELTTRRYVTVPSSEISNVEALQCHEADVFCLDGEWEDSIHDGTFNSIALSSPPKTVESDEW